MEMLPESLCLAARADPLQPSCEYVYMDFTEEPPDGYFCILLSPSKKKQKKDEFDCDGTYTSSFLNSISNQ